MSVSRQELQELVESLPDAEIPAMIAVLSELGDEQVLDDGARVRLDMAPAESGDEISSEEPRLVD